MGLSATQLASVAAQSEISGAGDRRICICGHGARSHSSQALSDNPTHKSFRESGRDQCLPGRMECPCGGFRGVVEVEDPRVFIFRTRGPMGQHALVRGLAASLVRGKTVSEVDWACDTCGATHAVTPVAVSRSGQIAFEPSRDNRLLCADCRIGLGA